KSSEEFLFAEDKKQVFQLHSKYILSPIKSGLLLIEQQGAHERILYEHYLISINNHKAVSQQELFPSTIELNTHDAELLKELQAEIQSVGFDISEFSKNTFVINGVPSDVTEASGAQLLEQLLETYKQNLMEVKIDKRENVARSMAKNTSIKTGKILTVQEMQNVIDSLFACEMPYTSPSGKTIITTLDFSELEKLFKK
ncbi:MAG: DNA mismatch repair protein MutL, partial [Bacteroidia bacterium]|nr:DNA mismatch repair protein MutL [Bacteroidia bacterium]